MGLVQILCLFAVGALHPVASGLAPTSYSSCNNLMITGGHKVSIKDIPFIVAINEVDDDDDDKYQTTCAGSVIHERFIITAASCIDGDETKDRTVLLSKQNLNEESEDRTFLDVEKAFCHEDYDADSLANDICLLKLDGVVPFAWLIKAKLPEKDFDFVVGTSVNVTGWGSDLRGGARLNDLRQVTVPVVPQKCCDDIYEDFTDKQICAGARRRDFCEGDMGGPLTYNDILLGIISGEGECGKNPGVYTRVSSYLDWIADTINSNL